MKKSAQQKAQARLKIVAASPIKGVSDLLKRKQEEVANLKLALSTIQKLDQSLKSLVKVRCTHSEVERDDEYRSHPVNNINLEYGPLKFKNGDEGYLDQSPGNLKIAKGIVDSFKRAGFKLGSGAVEFAQLDNPDVMEFGGQVT